MYGVPGMKHLRIHILSVAQVKYVEVQSEHSPVKLFFTQIGTTEYTVIFMKRRLNKVIYLLYTLNN